MGRGVFISFEFNRPDRTYDRVTYAIRSICETAIEVHFAHWFVVTALSSAEIRDRLKTHLGESDKLIVIDITNSQAAWVNLGEDAAKRLQAQGF